MNKEQRDQLRRKAELRAHWHKTGVSNTEDLSDNIIPLLDYCDKLDGQLSELGTCITTHEYSCHPIYIRRGADGKRVSTTITLTEYHRTNLLWLMCDVAGYDRKACAVSGLNTGDWSGEIPNSLRIREDHAGYEEPVQKPNIDYTHHLRIPLQDEAMKALETDLKDALSQFLSNKEEISLLKRKLKAALDEIRFAYEDEAKYIDGAIARVEDIK